MEMVFGILVLIIALLALIVSLYAVLDYESGIAFCLCLVISAILIWAGILLLVPNKCNHETVYIERIDRLTD